MTTQRFHTRSGGTAVTKFLLDVSVAGIIVTSIVPEASRWFIFGPFSIAWLVFANLYNPKAFYTAFISPDIKSYSVYLWFLTYTIFYFTDYMYAAEIDRLFNYLRIGFSLLLFNYYLEVNNVKAVKRSIYFSLLSIVFVSITTLRGLAIDPMAARLLAMGREELTQELTGLMIGSFGFVYGLVFTSIALIGVLKLKPLRVQKFFFLSIALLAVYTIFSAAFMLGILLFITGIVLLFFKIRSTFQLILLSIAVFLGLFALSPNLYELLQYFGDTVANQSLSMRFHEMAHAVRFGTFEGTVNSIARWEFLTLSVDTFISNPIFGVGGFYGHGTELYGIGSHSEYFDQLARYGIFGSFFLFVALFSNAGHVYKRFIHSRQKVIYYCSMSTFFILGAINTFLFVPIIMSAYFIVPGIIWCFGGPLKKQGTAH